MLGGLFMFLPNITPSAEQKLTDFAATWTGLALGLIMRGGVAAGTIGITIVDNLCGIFLSSGGICDA